MSRGRQDRIAHPHQRQKGGQVVADKRLELKPHHRVPTRNAIHGHELEGLDALRFLRHTGENTELFGHRFGEHEMRLTKALDQRIFRLIQVETDPQTTNTSLSRLENCVSHAVLRSAGNVLSKAPIHEIPSRNTIVLPRIAPTAA